MVLSAKEENCYELGYKFDQLWGYTKMSVAKTEICEVQIPSLVKSLMAMRGLRC